MPRLELPIRAAKETARAHGITPDRCDILQDGHTLVLRLTDSLVARVVTDTDGPRRGPAWFARETAVARHLTERRAPVIPLHPDLPPGPHEHLGFTLNFWQYVTATATPASPAEIGRTLHQCHQILRDFPDPLPPLGILTESLDLLETLTEKALFPPPTIRLLRDRLVSSIDLLRTFPYQPLHGDAHPGNLMNTPTGLLWTDWEDAFAGPVEWDLASIIWNAKILDGDNKTVNAILTAYQNAGGQVNDRALHQSLIARAAVMSAWYPILYPDPDEARLTKLQRRLDWLEQAD